MVAAGACSAGAVLLLKGVPSFAPNVPSTLLVATYLLVGGAVLLVGTGFYLAMSSGMPDFYLPPPRGIVQLAAIGLLLALLEVFFVLGAKQNMPMPDAMVVYSSTSLGLSALIGFLLYAEALTWQRSLGLVLGLASTVLLLQSSKP